MPVRRFAIPSLLALTLAPALAAPTALPPPWLPLAPGAARCEVAGGSAELRNAALRFALSAHDGVLAPAAFDNGFTQAPHALKGELFSVTTRARTRLGSNDFRLDAAPVCEAVAARPEAARASERRPGVALRAALTEAATGLRVTWRAVLRDGTNYVREEVRFESAKEDRKSTRLNSSH